MVGNIIFPTVLLFLAIFHPADQLIELTDENSTGKFVSPEFFALKQCYGTMGESPKDSYRIQFRVVGKGHCQLLLCYPSQLDPYAIPNGMEPEIGYYFPNNLESNAWIEKCPVTDEHEKWHGIYVDVDIDTINLTLSFSTQTFPVKRDFILELANPSYSSLATKLQIFNLDSEQFEIKEFGNDEQIHQQFLDFQHKGASLADFAGLWALALDMLPSDLNQNKIKMFTLASKYNSHPGEHEHNNTCDVDSGKMVEDNCHIQAWFLEPGDKLIENRITENATNNSSIMDMKLPFIDESLLEDPLQINDTIHITGWVNVKAEGYFRIHLLHNWTEPDSIMGETILSILVRRNYINFESKYNFTKCEQPIGETITNIIGKSLEKNIDQKFSLDIVVDENGNFNLTLNCKESAFVFKQKIDPLKYASIDYILIEADSGWELYNYEIKKNKNLHLKPSTLSNSNNTSMPFSDPSYSLKLEYPINERDFYIIAKLELKKYATKFDINLVQHDGQQNNGLILLHFHANLKENFYQLGNCRNECKIWSSEKFINNSNIIKPLAAAGQPFFWIWLTHLNLQYNDAISIVNTEIHKMYTDNMGKNPNYIQFKGDLLLLDYSVESISKKFPLENAFNPFNQITIVMNLVRDEKVRISLLCLDEKKCLNDSFSHYSMFLFINENYMSLVYIPVDEYGIISNFPIQMSEKIEKIEKKMELSYNQTIKLFIYANQFEYQIFNGDELIFMANYWQFPTPDKFDTITINGMVYLPERKPRKEWKQFDSDIALPFSYILDKPLEIDSSIKIKMKFQEKAWAIRIYLQNNASVFDEHFGTNVLLLYIFTDPSVIDGSLVYNLNITAGRKINSFEYVNITKNSSIYEFGDFLDLEIIINENYYQIVIGGKNRFNIDHILPFEIVNFMRIESDLMGEEIIQTKIIWPSDSSSRWYTTPGQNQIELYGSSNLPEKEPLIMRLNKPLRINDIIMFKGKFNKLLNQKKEFKLKIQLLRDIQTTENKIDEENKNNDYSNSESFKILDVFIYYLYQSPSINTSVMHLYRDKFRGKAIVTGGFKVYDSNGWKNEIDLKIHVHENNFFVQIDNSKEVIFENDGLFWAVEYIKFFFEDGLNDQNFDMKEGFPKIVHDYGKDKELPDLLEE